MKAFNLEERITKTLAENIPANLVRRNNFGSKSYDYITGQTVVNILNNCFTAMGWDFVIDQYWLEDAKPDKHGNTYTFANCLGTLTIRVIDEETGEIHEAKRQGFGAWLAQPGQGHKDVYKSASTDALKKAASWFGIGSELRLNDEETAYFEELNDKDWTDEKRKEFAAEWELANTMASRYGLTEDKIQKFIEAISKGKYHTFEDVSPKRFKVFVEGLDGAIKQQIEKKRLAEKAKAEANNGDIL